MISTITLYPYNNSLADKYPQAAAIVLVECDATAGAFTVSLPDAALKHDQIFVFQKIDFTSNIVTTSSTSGQSINGAHAPGVYVMRLFQQTLYLSARATIKIGKVFQQI